MAPAEGHDTWPCPSAWPSLRRDEVHVWRAVLDHVPAHGAAMAAALAPDERERAERFRFDQDRGRFIAARFALRAILGGYTGHAPADLRLVTGRGGKPALAEDVPDPPRFNVSHSDGLALVAVARGREVGVDLERVRPERAEGIGERFFAPGERAALAALPPAARVAAFFATWTRKEAFVKLTGDGLGLGLDRFEVSVDPDERGPILRATTDPADLHRIRLESLDVAPGCAAALAVEGRDWALRCWGWPPGCRCPGARAPAGGSG